VENKQTCALSTTTYARIFVPPESVNKTLDDRISLLSEIWLNQYLFIEFIISF